MRVYSSIWMWSAHAPGMLEGVAPTLQHPLNRCETEVPFLALLGQVVQTPGQVPGFGSSVLGDAPTGTLGKST